MNHARKTVLACIDGSIYSNSVLDYAAWVSRGVAAPVKLLHNIEQRNTPELNLSGNLQPGDREDLLEELAELESRRSKILKEQGRAMLEEAGQRMQKAGVEEVSTLQRHGSLVESLIEMEEEIRVLVLGVRGESHEQDEGKLGAQLEKVIRSMHRPVLVVNHDFEVAPARLMLAYDGSEAARKALHMVITSPLYKRMECHLVHVGDSAGAGAIIDEAQAALENSGLKVTSKILAGDVQSSLLEYQQVNAIDLLVMGAFGHNRVKEILFGSVTHKLLSHAKVPLLLLR